jgi:hypothetical protein
VKAKKPALTRTAQKKMVTQPKATRRSQNPLTDLTPPEARPTPQVAPTKHLRKRRGNMSGERINQAV